MHLHRKSYFFKNLFAQLYGPASQINSPVLTITQYADMTKIQVACIIHNTSCLTPMLTYFERCYDNVTSFSIIILFTS